MEEPTGTSPEPFAGLVKLTLGGVLSTGGVGDSLTELHADRTSSPAEMPVNNTLRMPTAYLPV